MLPSQCSASGGGSGEVWFGEPHGKVFLALSSVLCVWGRWFGVMGVCNHSLGPKPDRKGLCESAVWWERKGKGRTASLVLGLDGAGAGTAAPCTHHPQAGPSSPKEEPLSSIWGLCHWVLLLLAPPWLLWEVPYVHHPLSHGVTPEHCHNPGCHHNNPALGLPTNLSCGLRATVHGLLSPARQEGHP